MTATTDTLRDVVGYVLSFLDDSQLDALAGELADPARLPALTHRSPAAAALVAEVAAECNTRELVARACERRRLAD